MAELSAFWDRLADKYAAQPIADEDAYRTKLARTQAHLTPEMDIFEFGCGTGGTAIAHAPHVRSVRAIDFFHPHARHGPPARRRGRCGQCHL